jgi:hypothetical protein
MRGNDENPRRRRAPETTNGNDDGIPTLGVGREIILVLVPGIGRTGKIEKRRGRGRRNTRESLVVGLVRPQLLEATRSGSIDMVKRGGSTGVAVPLTGVEVGGGGKRTGRIRKGRRYVLTFLPNCYFQCLMIGIEAERRYGSRRWYMGGLWDHQRSRVRRYPFRPHYRMRCLLTASCS